MQNTANTLLPQVLAPSKGQGLRPLRGFGPCLTMSLTIERLDRRHNGFPTWTHRALVMGPHTSRLYEFYQLRVKCWENFGPSCSRDEVHVIILNDPEFNPVWSWHRDTQNGRCHIYFKGDDPITSWLLLQA